MQRLFGSSKRNSLSVLEDRKKQAEAEASEGDKMAGAAAATGKGHRRDRHSADLWGPAKQQATKPSGIDGADLGPAEMNALDARFWAWRIIYMTLFPIFHAPVATENP
ncbi:uncharacterized protein J7T54_005947 [Emericellopsis cladophorae]|uniref:Uncharacterized protein n=1 Tax=Emericellopsis cladophorae TaxID=2686198 RepID=A0A9P9Y910_9HYPO|nr:uncharacterized protein J7T54_005947 [Emericellopsis cladophorae]KAI6785613.1 hypothetical protein J7T54_005947 [Emericellopsis cladophorae]